MKKPLKIFSVIVMVSLAAPVFAQTASTSAQIQSLLNQLQQLQSQMQQLQVQRQAVVANLVSTLSQGANGDQVKVLQALLAVDPSVYPEGLITGSFGPLTRKAVARFQKKHGLPQVGAVGKMTLKALNRELENHPIALEHANSTSSNATSTGDAGTPAGGRPCAIVPPGHLIALGWLRKNDGVRPVVPPCQTLPPGISNILQRSSTTPPLSPPTPAPTSTPTSTVDIVPPVISNLTSVVASTSAAVSWTTNEPATSQVFYGTSAAMGSSTVLDASLVASHSKMLLGLTASTTYYYVAQSKDAAGNLASSTQQTFTELGQ